MGNSTDFNNKRWTSEGPVVYDLTQKFLSQKNMYAHDDAINLQGWWRFNENITITTDNPGGTAVDSSGKGNDSYYYGDPQGANNAVPTFSALSGDISNISSYAVNFSTSHTQASALGGIVHMGAGKSGSDGSLAALSTSSWKFYRDSFTISIWCKRASVSIPEDTGSGSWLWLLAGNTTDDEGNFGHAGVGISTTTSKLLFDVDASHSLNREAGAINADVHLMDDTDWHLVTTTYESSSHNWTLYLDGQFIGSHIDDPDLKSNDMFIVGGELDSLPGQGAEQGDGTWIGSIAEVALWSKVLSAESVAALYNAQSEVMWQVRDFRKKGSTVTNYKEGLEFLQGVNLKTIDQLHSYITAKIHPNSGYLSVAGNQEVITRWFDDQTSPTNSGYRQNFTALTVHTSRYQMDTGQGSLRVSLVPNHYMEQSTIGITQLHDDGAPFHDADPISAVKVIVTDPFELDVPMELLGASQMIYTEDVYTSMGAKQGDKFEIVSRFGVKTSDAYSGISLMDGVLEPFEIRKQVDRSSINHQFPASGVRGSIGPGEDTWRRNHFIKDQYDLDSAPLTPYFDGIELFGSDILSSAPSGSISLQGFVKSDYTPVTPFKDTTDMEQRTSKISDTELGHFLSSARHTFTGSAADGVMGVPSLYNDPYGDLGRNHKFATHGIEYFGSALGTDSIVYGDLKR